MFLLLLTLHIMALVFWVACLFYLPALLAGRHGDNYPFEEPPEPFDSLARVVFTRIATPVALVAIVAGTLVFVVDLNISPWLLLKLTLVAMLVVAHALLGVLVLRAEANNGKPVKPWCWLFLMVLTVLIPAILWVVLAKPTGIGGIL